MTSSTSRIAPDSILDYEAQTILDTWALDIHPRTWERLVAVYLAGKYAATPAQPAREWIPVGERLPTHIYSVLGLVTHSPHHACDADDPMLAVCSFLPPPTSKWVMGDGPSDIVIQVTHWMPLPPPPAVDK